MGQKRWLWVFHLFLLTMGLSPSGAEAGCPDFLKPYLNRFKALYSSHAAEDLSGTVQVFRNPTSGEVREVCLLERIGTGSRGAVYRIPPAPDGVARVAKIEKGFRLPMLPKHKLVLQEGIQRELRVTEALNASIGEIETASAFPKNAPWNKGVFPVLPILETYESTLGIVLIKPEMKNPIKIQSLPLSTKGQLKPEVEEGLKQIYALQQAVHQSVKSIDGTGEGMFLDIGPSNIFWVEDPLDLKQLKMSRPGFFLFEADQGTIVTGNPPVVHRNHQYYPDFKSYRDAVILQIRAQGW
ncbi:MAG: hypothetical protein KGP28_06595 [Bdellovibrionales bacterium]|nr:hypothetical protein [Bdellovibrionales bacterium]